MDYKTLNELHRKKMSTELSVDFEMEWQDDSLMNTLLGSIPKIRHLNGDNEIAEELKELEGIYKTYDVYETNKDQFIDEIDKKIGVIKEKKPYWQGLNIWDLRECLDQQKACVISGEGGIGKTYFIKKFEDELENKKIDHLCIYGKFEKDLSRIDFKEIAKVAAKKRFVLVIDALNEIPSRCQLDILNKVEELRDLKGFQCVITYRTYTIEKSVLEKCNSISESVYAFQGVSFESALEGLLKIPVKNIYKYENILYSNNALLLSQLCKVLNNPKFIEEKLNNVATITFILEEYIKWNLDIFFWRNTKKVAMWMYENNKKSISAEALNELIDDTDNYIEGMKKQGFISDYIWEGIRYYAFKIELLTDYLIARSLFDDLRDKDKEEQIRTIKEKNEKIYGISEALILAVFDKFSSDFSQIKEILTRADLMRDLNPEVLNKINFTPTLLNEFKKVFNLAFPENALLAFGGYTDKPFNCVNFVDDYYLSNEEKQLVELTNTLSGKWEFESLKGRLKNILYFITMSQSKGKELEEAFSFALWCCAAPNNEVRCIALKLLFDIISMDYEYAQKAINLFPKIKDYYIQEAIVDALSSAYGAEMKEINDFFNELKANKAFTMAKCIYKIAAFSGKPYSYIDWDKENYYDRNATNDLSKILQRILMKVNLYDKYLLPFRFWSKDHIDMHHSFVDVEKTEIRTWNELLADNFACIKNNGDCNGSLAFQTKIEDKYTRNYRNMSINTKAFLNSFETILKEVFLLYGLEYKEDTVYVREWDSFNDTVFAKCILISKQKYYGSIMCNYYSNEFSTYNNVQNSIGYDIYDPVEYEENIYVTSPIPTYNSAVESMGQELVSRIVIPELKDENWVKNIDLTRSNLMSLTSPIIYEKSNWRVLAARICIRESIEHSDKWIDTYDFWCCTSENYTIKGDGNDRYLTIELDEYKDYIGKYSDIISKPELCKRIPDISYGLQCFDECSLVLPPADIIKKLNLTPCYKDLSWKNENGIDVIRCNNTKSSYYKDPIGSTVFIREDAYNTLLESGDIKFFAFTERYIPTTGYANETSVHFEIENDEIVKEFFNHDQGRPIEEIPNDCKNCKWEFNKKDYEESDFLKILKQYKVWDEDTNEL